MTLSVVFRAWRAKGGSRPLRRAAAAAIMGFAAAPSFAHGPAGGDGPTPPRAAFVAVDAVRLRAVSIHAGRFRAATAGGASFLLAGIAAPSAIGAQDAAALAHFAAIGLDRPATLLRPRAALRRDGALFGHLIVDGVWVQHALAAAGFAFAAPGRADDSGAATLIAAETAAGRGRRGVWADQPRGPRVALSAAAARIGDFVVLKGRVRSTFRVDGDPALGLGRGRGDPYLVFRGGLEPDAAIAFVGAAATARGWLGDRDGPMVEIWSDAQLQR